MLPGPIFRVELVTAARRRRYFVLRALYATTILFVLWGTYASTIQSQQYQGDSQKASIQQVAAAATAFFVSFSWVQLIGLLAVAPAIAVGTIATERERRTIEYLFASDLSNAEIVLGKTFARLLLVGMFVLAGLPILYIFRLLGGIPASLLAASFLISCSTAVFLTALSVCISVWSKKSRDATVRVYLALVAILFLPLVLTPFGFFLFGGGQFWRRWLSEATTQLMRINPLSTLGEAIGWGSAAGANLNFRPIFEMVGWHAFTSCFLIGLATAAVRRVHLRESTRGDRGPGLLRRRLGAKLPTFLGRRRPVGNRPMIWKETYAGASKTALGIVGTLAAAAIALTMLGFTIYAFYQATAYVGWRDDYYEFLMVLSGLAAPAALILIAARASGLVTQEKERDAWLSLLATPMTGGEIIRGKLIGNLYAARWPLLLLGVSWVLGACLDWTFTLVVLAMTLTFVILATFVSMLGTFFSIRSATSLRAMGLTLGTSIFLGGGYMMCCCSVLAVGGGIDSDDGLLIGLAPCIPFLSFFPIFAYEALQEQRFGNFTIVRELNEFSTAYCVGILGYLVAAGVLYGNLTLGFDKLTERTQGRPDSSPPPDQPNPGAAEQPMPAG